MTRTAGEEMSPAFTAVSPSTIAPTMERDTLRYLGMRMEASLSTSKRSRTKSISTAGGKGMELVAPTRVMRNFIGSRWKW